LTQLYRAQRDSDDIKDDVRNLLVGSWEPSVPNGASTATWGRRDETSGQGQGGVDMCWDKAGGVVPLSLTDMTEEEKEVSCSWVFIGRC
jgi:PERQ amino acid-rich with GYF domain-containing protein